MHRDPPRLSAMGYIRRNSENRVKVARIGVLWSKNSDFLILACWFVQNMVLNCLVLLESPLVLL